MAFDGQLTDRTGLTQVQAEELLAAGKGNAIHQEEGNSVGRILRRNLFTFFNLLNLILAVALLAVGSYRNMLFLGTVISNLVIGTFQELRARHTLQKLSLLNMPQVTVRREGEERKVRSDETVLGDLVILQAGDQVPADALVVEGRGAVNEALLTGESDAIRKAPGDELLSGSYLTEGHITAQLTKVGDDSYAAGLTRQAKAISRPKSMLMSDMNRLIKMISVLLVPVGLILFLKQYFLHQNPVNQVVANVAASLVGMIPNGLMLLVSVALMVGVIRLAGKQTLVQELYGIETLARADTLCLDKTGTLTTGQMKLESLIPVEGTEEEMRQDLGRFLGAFRETNLTSQAILRAIPATQTSVEAVIPFSSARKMSAASFGDGTLMLGAPGFVWQGDLPEELLQQIREQSAQGFRVLLLAKAEEMIDGEVCPAPTKVLGLVVLSDELRPTAEKTLASFREQGVTLKIISGDSPDTVAAIAGRLGVPGAERCVDVSTLKDESLEAAADAYTVFGRVTPERKRMLVEALKRKGHRVAMTGDGVNDIPAMKAADCSIAMASGSDAARQSAQLTLLNSDFASLPLVVAEGRRVVNNTTRTASLYLMKTLYSLLLSLVMILLPLNYPFQPIQLTLIAALTIGVPSFFLALEPNGEPIKEEFLRTIIRNALPGGLAVTLSACAAMALEAVGYANSVCSTMATVCAGIAGIVMLFEVCQPMNRSRAIMLGLMAVGMAGAMLIWGKFFYVNVRLLPAELLAAVAVWCVLCGVLMGLFRKWAAKSKGRLLNKLGL